MYGYNGIQFEDVFSFDELLYMQCVFSNNDYDSDEVDYFMNFIINNKIVFCLNNKNV